MVKRIKIFFTVLSIILIGLDIRFLPVWFPKSLSQSLPHFDRDTYEDLCVALCVITFVSIIIAASKITINGDSSKSPFNSDATISKPSISDAQKTFKFNVLNYSVKTTPLTTKAILRNDKDIQ